MRMSTHKPAKVGLFGHFGSTNPGNEATLLAVVSRLRLIFPECEFLCICTSPRNVVAACGIEAVGYTVKTARIWNRQAPLHERARQVIPGLREEAREYLRAWRTLEAADLMVIPGTGLLNDAWGLSGWGPYGLLKWSFVARVRGCKVIFMSVGAGPVRSRLGRLLLRSTLSLAHYRSYRDIPSREVVESLGVSTRDDRIYPDLVFDLSPLPTPTAATRDGGRPVVGLGLMEYTAKYSSPSASGDTYGRYLEALAMFVGWLLDHEYDVKLLLGDADTVVIEAFRTALREQLGHYDEERVTDPVIGSVDTLLSQLGATDFVVATRFHNVLLSLLLGKPPIAISFHHKVSALMNDMGLSEYCHDINQMNADRLIAQFEAVVRNADELKLKIADRVAERRLALDEQYELLFGRLPGAPELGEAIVASCLDPPGERGARGQRTRLGRRLDKILLTANRGIWNHLPNGVRELHGVQVYGRWLHALTCRNANREMYLGTSFLRNRPALELMRNLIADEPSGSTIRVAVLGCSVGVEVYSILWTLRRERPDLKVAVDALDISPDVLAIAEEGVYGPQTSEAVTASIFQQLTEAERREMFDWKGDQAVVKPWLKEGVTWRLGDASDPRLVEQLGPKDFVVANNFLCHMDPRDADRCLRNLARLAKADGYLFVSGVDLNVRTKVALDLAWDPVPDLVAEIHDGDALVRADWPFNWWGLEPLDRRRPDWETRYASVFRLCEVGSRTT
jgi:chemotaxis protein methyltransferase CheR